MLPSSHIVCLKNIISQVYRGDVLSESGEKQQVAVKVLHPNVEEDIDADLDLMRVAVRAAKYMPFDIFANLKWLNMEGVVEEFAALLKLQLDLRTEASNLERFNENFKDEEGVVFPTLVKGFEPTRHVLVETFCNGIPVLQWARENRDDRELLTNMCRKAIEVVCKQIFLDNFMHGTSVINLTECSTVWVLRRLFISLLDVQVIYTPAMSLSRQMESILFSLMLVLWPNILIVIIQLS